MKRSISFLLIVVTLMICTSCGFFNNGQAIKNAAYKELIKRFDSVTVEEVSTANDLYYAYCYVSSSGKYFDVSAKATLKFNKTDKAWELMDEPFYEDQKFVFHTVDEFYEYGRSGKNISTIFKIESMDKTGITVRYYSHSLVSSGSASVKDDYDNGTDTWALEYIEGDDGLLFSFLFFDVGITFRIYPNYIDYPDENSGNYYTGYRRFIKLKPVNPNDYWWFERASGSSDND